MLLIGVVIYMLRDELQTQLVLPWPKLITSDLLLNTAGHALLIGCTGMVQVTLYVPSLWLLTGSLEARLHKQSYT